MTMPTTPYLPTTQRRATRFARVYSDGSMMVSPADRDFDSARRDLLASADDDDVELLEVEITVVRTHGRPRLQAVRQHRCICPTCGETLELDLPDATTADRPAAPTDLPVRIAAAAIRLPDGRVMSLPPPARHHHVLAHALDQGTSREAVCIADQGFVTTGGAWCDRRTALRIAQDAGQLLGEPTAAHAGLFSEDVW